MAALKALWKAFAFAVRVAPIWVVVALVLTVVTGIALPAQVYLVGMTVAQFEDAQPGSIYMAPMIALASTYGVAAAISTFRQVGSDHLGARVAVGAQSRLLESFGHIVVEDLMDPDVRDRIDIVWGTARDRLSSFISSAIGWTSTVVSAVGVFAVLCTFSPLIGALVGLASLGPILTTPYLLRAYRTSLQHSAPVSREVSVGAVYIVSSEGYRDLKASGSYSLMREGLVDAMWRSARIQLTFTNRQGAAGIFLFAWIIVTLSVAMFVMANSGYGAADIAAVLSAMTALNSLVAVFVTGGTLIQQLPFVGQLFEVLHGGAGFLSKSCGAARTTSGDQVGADGKHFQAPDRGDFWIRGVGFSYKSSPKVLDGVDLTLRSGEITALVGRNGEGKTTLMRVLQGAYMPSSGVLHYGDSCITGLMPSLVGSLSCSVQQDVPRPPMTVHDYLCCGRDVPEARLNEVLKQVGVDFLGDGRIRRRIGPELENGTDFSGGQWQKLSIARLLLSESPLWLLDEPASALDPESEIELMRTLRREMGPDRIVVIVSHRLSTVLQADTYALMSNGRVEEVGAPRDAIVREDSALRRLFTAQIT